MMGLEFSTDFQDALWGHHGGRLEESHNQAEELYQQALEVYSNLISELSISSFDQSVLSELIAEYRGIVADMELIIVFEDGRLIPDVELDFEDILDETDAIVIRFDDISLRMEEVLGATSETVRLYDIFECPMLARIVANSLSSQLGQPINPSDNIRLDKVQSLVELEVFGTQIASLHGMEYLTGLNELWMGNMELISDLSPLRELVNLTSLIIQEGTGITDITPLANLTNLYRLAIEGASINSLISLENLTNLRVLEVSYSNISNITPIENLTNLYALNLVGNAIADITPIADLTNLENLQLGYNQIKDLNPLSGLTRLESLGLSDNYISDFRPLSSLSNLIWLGAMRQNIQLDPVFVGEGTRVELFLIDGSVPYMWGLGEFTFVDQILTWNTAGEKEIFWELMGGGSTTFFDFSGTIHQTVLPLEDNWTVEEWEIWYDLIDDNYDASFLAYNLFYQVLEAIADGIISEDYLDLIEELLTTFMYLDDVFYEIIALEGDAPFEELSTALIANTAGFIEIADALNAILQDEEPTDPEPTDPEPTDPEPTDPEPTDPEPTDPEPTDPEPTDPEPTDPEPTDPEPTDPEPTDPEPTDPEPTDPEPTDPEPTDPEPTDPEPTDPEPTDPDPSELGPSETGPSGTDPSATQPTTPPTTAPNNNLPQTGAVIANTSLAGMALIGTGVTATIFKKRKR